MPKLIQIYDTTLRDGTQAEDIAFTVEDKLRIAEKLDGLGVHYIEGGWPGANPKDSEFFERARRELKLKRAKLVAFGSTRRASSAVEGDEILKSLLSAGTKTVCIFGKSWNLHVTRALGISPADNLKLVSESVAWLKKNRRAVIYDAEHFFDGFKADKKYALESVKAAIRAGADRIVLCDTNGGSLPSEIEKIVRLVRKAVRAPLGIHCHDDAGLGVANSLAAVCAGVTQVQGTLNGIGERCGNANLVSIMADLELKMGYICVGPAKLARLRETALFIDEMANRASNRHQPYVGDSAFAHKGGVHVSAILKEARTYEHVDPKKVGNIQRVLVSDLSGASTIAHKAKEFGLDLKKENPQVRVLLEKLKEMENRGYQFEGAEASFEILVKKALGEYRPHFILHDFRVTDTISLTAGAEATSEAVIHLAVEGREEKASSRGVGPVHALDQALRKALERFYPRLAEMKLLDYKVRVLRGIGTASVVRVLIECGDTEGKWGTVGVSENIIHASYQALVDSIDYKLMKSAKGEKSA
ncbi:MAG: citramalate synthase [Deltaproteobacteria bacterium]|nr:citramalate synthase [Deltaproteobacteria bacterium]